MLPVREDRSRSRDRDRSDRDGKGKGKAILTGGQCASEGDGKGKGKGHVDAFLLRRVNELEGRLNLVVWLVTARLERIEEDQADMRRCWPRQLPQLINTGLENRPPRTGNDALDRLMYRES